MVGLFLLPGTVGEMVGSLPKAQIADSSVYATLLGGSPGVDNMGGSQDNGTVALSAATHLQVFVTVLIGYGLKL